DLDAASAGRADELAHGGRLPVQVRSGDQAGDDHLGANREHVSKSKVRLDRPQFLSSLALDWGTGDGDGGRRRAKILGRCSVGSGRPAVWRAARRGAASLAGLLRRRRATAPRTEARRRRLMDRRHGRSTLFAPVDATARRTEGRTEGRTSVSAMMIFSSSVDSEDERLRRGQRARRRRLMDRRHGRSTLFAPVDATARRTEGRTSVSAKTFAAGQVGTRATRDKSARGPRNRGQWFLPLSVALVFAIVVIAPGEHDGEGRRRRCGGVYDKTA
ncbi:hypothetical protein THAOC_06187, partial [Thalassiosira oceanica]